MTEEFQPVIYDDDTEDFNYKGVTVKLKRRMSHRDQRRLESEFLNLATKLKDGAVNPEQSKPLLLLLNIVGWSLTDREGKPLPVTAENIDRLDHAFATAIAEEVNKRNVALKKDRNP